MSPVKVQHFTSLAKFLHWLMAFIWIGAWFIGYIAVTWREALELGCGQADYGALVAQVAAAYRTPRTMKS